MQMNDRLFTAIALALIACVVGISEVLVRFDHLYYDLGRHFSFKRAPDNIVIVAIDERSIEAIGSWPWSRRFHTELINHLINEKQSKLDSVSLSPIQSVMLRKSTMLLPKQFNEQEILYYLFCLRRLM